jgi:catechol-2,3-dioxygenase
VIKTVWCITLCASDLRRVAKFYEETLGLEKKYAYPSYVGFECGGTQTGLIPRLRGRQTASTVSPAVAFLVDHVIKVYSELKNKGAKKSRE